MSRHAQRTTKGKCESCHLVFEWAGLPRLKNSLCPQCGAPLLRATHLKQWPVVWRKPKVKTDAKG